MENGRSWSGRIPLAFEDAASSRSVNPRSASNAGIGTSYHSCAHTAYRCPPSELLRRIRHRGGAMEVGSLAHSWLERIRRAWRVRGLEREVAASRRGHDQ